MPNNTMKANPYAGTGKVFVFSLKQMLCSKGWLISTIIFAALLLIGIPLMLFGISKASAKSEKKDDAAAVRTVYVADETAGTADYALLKDTEEYPDVEYIACTSMDDAASQAAGNANAVILRVTKPSESYALTVYLTDDTAVSRSKASSFGEFVADNFKPLLMQKANLTAEEAAQLSMPVLTETASISAEHEETDEKDDLLTQLFTAIIPFMMVMMVYMMVVLYGQSMANSVMLEKTSKLMETILTAVHPVALMSGKLLATACAALIQIAVWAFSAIGGMIGGAVFAIRMVPDTSNETVLMMESMTHQTIEFSVAGIFATLIVMALGFLLYLAVATVSGAMASKQEDLNKTIVVFTLVIVASLLLCIRPNVDEVSGSFGLISDAKWLRFFPFTALLVLPSDLIFGKLTVPEALLALLCLAVSVVLLVWFAAAVYKMLVLYRGEPLKFRQLIGMLRGKKKPEHPDAGAQS